MVLVVGGCASSPRTRRVEAVQKLEEDVEKLKQTKADKADSNVQLDDFKTELQLLSGKEEENAHLGKTSQKNLEKSNARIDKLIADYDQKIVTLEQQLKKQDEKNIEVEKKLADLEKQMGEKVQAHQKKVETSEHADVKMDYANGMKRFKAKEYSSAITLFTRYVQNFPSGRSTKNARFYLADSYYQKQDYQNAILKFEEFKEKHSKDTKIAEALYKQGLSFVSLGKKSDAQLFFNEIVSKYAESSYANKAKAELDKLK